MSEEDLTEEGRVKKFKAKVYAKASKKVMSGIIGRDISKFYR